MKRLNNNIEGFTLIEMLIVVAVIGVLSSILLTSLGPSRDKAKDTRIIQELNQIRSLAQSLDDGDYDAVPSLNGIAEIELLENPEIKGLASDIISQGGEVFIKKPFLSYGEHARWFVIYSKVNTPAGTKLEPLINYFCVDSSGKAGYTTDESHLLDQNKSQCP